MPEEAEPTSLGDDLKVFIPKGSVSDEESQELLREEKNALKERRKEDIEDRKTAREQRKRYAKWIFLLVCGWITAIFCLLITQMVLQSVLAGFKPLSDKVLLALITSTTVDLIGTLIIVLRYIFHVPEQK